MDKKTRRARRSASAETLVKRRFHADVRRLKQLSEKKGWTLMTYEQADSSAVCALSSHDYEIGSSWLDCDENNENYFLSQAQYEEFSILND